MAIPISDLTQLTTPANGDEIPIVDVSANATKKITWEDFFKSPPIDNLSWATTSLANPYKFSAYRNSAWTLPTASFAKVVFDTELFDTNSNFATGTYTAPVSGFYQLSAGVSGVIGANALFVVDIYKNGSAALIGTQFSSNSTTECTGTVIGLLSLAANDTVEVFVFGDTGVGGTGATKTYFHGYLVSRT